MPAPKKPAAPVSEATQEAGNSEILSNLNRALGTKRETTDGPWMWANKAALKKIRDSCDEDWKARLAVYLALCEIASDERTKGEFKAPMDRIAAKCGYSRRAVFDKLNELEALQLISICRSATSENYRVPSSYVILPFKS